MDACGRARQEALAPSLEINISIIYLANILGVCFAFASSTKIPPMGAYVDVSRLHVKIEKCSELNTEEISETVNTFAKEWPNDIKGSTDDFIAEMTMWRRHCLNMLKDKWLKIFIDTLNNCDSVLYQSIHRFLQISTTLPVSMATNERSFSCLRKLKTYLSNKTGEE
ncbi:Hypothetical protein CINCED_3A003536 [Cinara cedri]|uniref:HAT C-terminal dimerisation domain-containing protein n=1 Tax=Cinara cedri TaxID=506608 RepID=A0A5E4N3X1_9HEMI|nr:Hypothetical protein CINCED_3A003536 [Cinara cedri]